MLKGYFDNPMPKGYSVWQDAQKLDYNFVDFAYCAFTGN
jgi:hypothetical protein